MNDMRVSGGEVLLGNGPFGANSSVSVVAGMTSVVSDCIVPPAEADGPRYAKSDGPAGAA